ncbi:hypothetical protein [Grimontia marina]|uniref:Phage Tail Collar Domain protein n=1 Tax=Grimontia marina TaxID=646534 RepID=A0A128EY09_9GAMM|nr:hypothetical protein [Grimontia marina]CZF79459.1 hypothetical protein GMA8713_00982 [Grimontia marina]
MPRLNAGGWKSGDVKIHSGTLNDIPSGWVLAADMVDRAVVGAGRAYKAGQQFGSDEARPIITTRVWVNNHTLSNAQMPSHTHGMQQSKSSGSGSLPYSPKSGNLSGGYSTNTGSNGSSHAHSHGSGASSSSTTINTRQKSIAVIWIRKL